MDTSRSEEPVTSTPASWAIGCATSVTEVRSASCVNRSSMAASCMPSACAVTRYGPPTRSPVAVNAPLALVVVASDVPVGRCTIETLAPGIGWPSAPTTKPARLLVVSCAAATGPARIATTPAPSSTAGADRMEDTVAARRTERGHSGMGVASPWVDLRSLGPKCYSLPARHGDPVEWRPMRTRTAELRPHPQSPCEAVRRISVEIGSGAGPGVLQLRYCIEGDIARL